MRVVSGKERLVVCLSEIINLYVEIRKSKNELFEVSCILMYLAIFFINLPQSSLRINPGQVQNYQTFEIFRWSQSKALKK